VPAGFQQLVDVAAQHLPGRQTFRRPRRSAPKVRAHIRAPCRPRRWRASAVQSGRKAGGQATVARRPPSAAPARPPAAASRRLSQSTLRASACGVAPSARRTASCGMRTSPRESMRLARFTHATSSTRPTAPMSSSSELRRPPVRCSSNGLERDRPALVDRRIFPGERGGDGRDLRFGRRPGWRIR